MADTLVLEASAERRASSSLAGGTSFIVRHFTDKEVWSAVFNQPVPYFFIFRVSYSLVITRGLGP